MGKPAVVYTPRPDVTPEAELSALAQVYKFVLETKKAAGTSGGGEDAHPDRGLRTTKEVRAK